MSIGERVMSEGGERWGLTCEEKTPNASHRLNSAMGGVPSNLIAHIVERTRKVNADQHTTRRGKTHPPMSDVQNPNPLMPKLSPPLRLSDIASHVDSQSPPQ